MFIIKEQQQKRHHAHLAEDDNEERHWKKTRSEGVEEYVLFSALSGSVTLGEDTWLIDSGASKHMIGKNQNLSRLNKITLPVRYH